jgi:hypothetical protein
MSSRYIFPQIVLSLCILLVFDGIPLYGKASKNKFGIYNLYNSLSIKKYSEISIRSESLKLETIGDEVYASEYHDQFNSAKAICQTEVGEIDTGVSDFGSSKLVEIESYEKIKKQAQEEGKFIFVNFYGKNCSLCVLLEGTIASNVDIQSVISQHYVLYKIDVNASRKHPLVKKLGIRKVPLFAIVSPWGHVLNVYMPSNNPEAIRNMLVNTAEKVDLQSIFQISDSLSNGGSSIAQIAGQELLKSSFGSSVVNQQYLYKEVLGPRKEWDDRQKRELIFKLLPSIQDPKLQAYFLNHLIEFRNIYSKKELNEKVYELAFLGAQMNYDLNDIFLFLEQKIIDDVDYYLIRSEVDYYTFIFPDTSARFNAQLDLYTEFQYDEWSKFRSVLYEMILTAKTQEDFYYLEEIALKYEPYAVDYEWLDLYCLLLYKSGLEEDALGLINEIKAKAMAKGINYRPAIYGLQKDGDGN